MLHFSEKMIIFICTLIIFNVNAFNHHSLLKKTITSPTSTNKLTSIRKFGADILNKPHGSSNKLLKMVSVDSVEEKVVEKPLQAHKGTVEGTLSNGLAYVVLPNANPPGRFEAYIEVLSGSIDEMDDQQGMAHLLEHTCYVGSPKRYMLSGTGSKTNAYTDFHHTVYFAGCPTEAPDSVFHRPMLPLAFDALVDVLTCQVDDSRLEKERAAVLSEASMVNKMDYRAECQVLATLHNENRLCRRFPIGKEEQLKTFTKEQLQYFHDLHYRPDNVILYVVGDLAVEPTVDLIRQKFGPLTAKLDTAKIIRESAQFTPVSMRQVNRHFPPLLHRWSAPARSIKHLLPIDQLVRPSPSLLQPPHFYSASDNVTGLSLTLSEVTPPQLLPVTTIFSHELLKSFSFHLFAKRPIEPVTSEHTLKRDLLRKLAMMALQIRLNVDQRQEPLFTMIDFNYLNWPREGCAVCNLDFSSDVMLWRQAVKAAVKEVRRLGLYGLTPAELARYKQSMLNEAAQTAAQAEGATSEDLLAQLMEHGATGSTFMDPVVKYHSIESLLHSISLDEVNLMAREVCEHLSHANEAEGVVPGAMIACSPTLDRNGQPCDVSESTVRLVMAEALVEPVEPLKDTPIPDTLITREQLQEKLKQCPPEWIPLPDAELTEVAATVGVVQGKLGNGIRVNLKSLDSESQRLSLRVYIPGGRLAEDRKLPGSVLLGAKTMQEGGAFLNMTREEVELFCIDHMIMVEITANAEALVFDLSALTTKGPGGQVTGAEAAMQVAHILLTDFKYEVDAFERARQAEREKFDSTVRGLETVCLERLTSSVCDKDPRYLQPDHDQLDQLDVVMCSEAIKRQLNPSCIEVSIAGDMSVDAMKPLAMVYLGTVPSSPRLHASTASSDSTSSGGSSCVKAPVLTAAVGGGGAGPKKQTKIGIFQSDTDERAMGYVAGPSPNNWGVMHSGQTVTQLLAASSHAESAETMNRRQHPAFAYAALKILEEIANRRLFTLVREERQLTYDANFHLQDFEAIQGGWYIVSVTSSPSQVLAALEACQEALTSLTEVTADAMQAAKRTILNKFRAEKQTNKFWVERLSGTQLEYTPYKNIRSLTDFESVLQSITHNDILDLVKVFKFEEENMSLCVGVTAPELPMDLKTNFEF